MIDEELTKRYNNLLTENEQLQINILEKLDSSVIVNYVIENMQGELDDYYRGGDEY